MSDYLLNLAARSLGATEVVQPRLASLFEPPHAARGSVLGQFSGPKTSDIVQASDEATIEILPPAAQPASRRIEPQPPATDLGLSGQETHPGPNDALTKPVLLAEPGDSQPKSRPGRCQAAALQSPAVVSMAPPFFEARPERLSSQPGPELQEPAVSRTRPPDAQPPVVRPFVSKAAQQDDPNRQTLSVNASKGQTAAAPDRSDPEQQLQPVPGSFSRRATAAQGATPMERRLLSVPRLELLAVQTPRPATLATVFVQPRITPYAEPTRRATAESTATPEPTIQVTIGRVEIRAAPPPARQSAAELSAAPAMSLDEYLRRRAKGGGQ